MKNVEDSCHRSSVTTPSIDLIWNSLLFIYFCTVLYIAMATVSEQDVHVTIAI